MLILFAAMLVCGGAAHADDGPITVRVGVYEYGVVYFIDDHSPEGFARILVEELNSIQDKYRFEMIETSTRRRHMDLMSGEFDMILLESPYWNWQGLDVRMSDPIVTEHDLFVARRTDVPGSTWFDNVSDRHILAVLGFSYGFTDDVTDPDELNRRFDISLLYNEDAVLRNLLDRHGDVAVISAGYLALRYQRDPALADQVIIGPQTDSSVDLHSILSPQSAISADEYNALLAQLHTSGNIAQSWRRLHEDLSQ